MQPEEREYLHQIAEETGAADAPELQPLLHEFVAVSPQNVTAGFKNIWAIALLRQSAANSFKRSRHLIFKDGNVASEESSLLANLQLLDSMASLPEERQSAVLSTIHKLYAQWLDEKNNSS
jgi:hypothetical protein